MGRVQGKVAFITGAARGQGRSHAVRLAEEGADIIAVDICEDVATVPYGGATEADLAETAKEVEALDRRIVARKADVRDLAALTAVAAEGVAEFGGIDIVCANAGIGSFAPALDLDEETWQNVVDINLTGVWKTVKATAPGMVERGQGGSIILTSSIARADRLPASGPLHSGQAWRHRADAHAGRRAGTAQHPGELGAPHHCRHPHGGQRGDLGPVPGRSAGRDPRTGGRWHDRAQRDASAVGGGPRHQQRGAVPGVGRGALRHRHDNSDRRGRNAAL